MSMICPQCKMIHSDWVSCERAKYTGEFTVPLYQEQLATLERDACVAKDASAKPVFDRWAHLAKARAARKSAK